jgi:hypothetical protein
MWSADTWEMVKSNLDLAMWASGNPYHATALAIRDGLVEVDEEGLPEVVEAVAAYGSEQAWRAEVGPESTPDAHPRGTPVMEALVQVARPLLVPADGGNEMDKLRAAVDLALDPDFHKARYAYFTWFRDFLEPLRSNDPNKENSLNAASITVIKEKLRELHAQEVDAAKRVDRKRWGSRVEFGCVTASAVGAIGLAAVSSLPALGVGVGVLSLGGWAAKRLTENADPRTLSGASMFVDAQRRLDWLPAS